MVDTAAGPTSSTTAPGVTRASVAVLPLLVPPFAAAAATLAGMAIYAVLDATGDEEGLGELLYVVLAVFIAGGLAVAITIAGLAVLARRLFVARHRAAPVVLASLALVAVFGLFFLTSLVNSDMPPTPVTVLLALAFLLAPSMVFAWFASRRNNEPLVPSR